MHELLQITIAGHDQICQLLITCSIFQDVAGDVTVIVDGESFLLHKVKPVTLEFCLLILQKWLLSLSNY